MTINEAISRVDELKHNTYPVGEKIKWLSAVDSMVKRLIIDTHKGADKATAIAEYIFYRKQERETAVNEYMLRHEVTRAEAESAVPEVKISYQEAEEWVLQNRNDVMFQGYTEDTSGETMLLAPEPFDQMYLRWMEAQVDYHNAEYSKYNNAIALFNTEFQAYADHYHRKHKPKGSGNWSF